MSGVHTESVTEEDVSMTPQEQQEIIERNYEQEDQENREARMRDKAGVNHLTEHQQPVQCNQH